VSNNDNEKPNPDPTVDLDAHRGLRAQKETDRRRHRSAVQADQEVVRQNQASLEKFLFAGPATSWVQAAEKATHLLRLFAATGEGQDPRYRQLIEDALSDLERLSAESEPPAP
jgi:hypothetical protein